jgi:hypothetical protein
LNAPGRQAPQLALGNHHPPLREVLRHRLGDQQGVVAADRFDLDFHVAACEELLRVADELRVFPLLGLDRRWSPHVGPVCEHLRRAGFEAEVVAAEYEFQKAAGHACGRMLRVSKEGGRPR